MGAVQIVPIAGTLKKNFVWGGFPLRCGLAKVQALK
jgi:hypothetical protein